MNARLETRGLRKSFGALTVADDINLRLEAGARHALIGPNGAGKTSLVNMLTGNLRPSAGSILLEGEDVTRLAPEARVKRGLGRTFQISSLFAELSLLDNVALGVAERHGLGGRMWRRAGTYREVRDEAMEVLASLELGSDAMRPVRELPYGKQRLAEIAIALGLRPKVLLLDEPAAGVPSHESQRILDLLGALPLDVAILIIEHDMSIVFRFARRITVLVRGQVLCEGTPEDIAGEPRVHELYLGDADG